MFDMGFAELLLIAVIALIVIGPKRMPEAVRVIGYWLGKFRRSVHNARQEMEREFGLDDIRRDLHNESLLAQLEKERRQMEEKFTIGQQAAKDNLESDQNNGDHKPDENGSDNVGPESQQEMLRAFEDFEKEFGIEPDGKERPNDESNREDADQTSGTTSRSS